MNVVQDVRLQLEVLMLLHLDKITLRVFISQRHFLTEHATLDLVASVRSACKQD